MIPVFNTAAATFSDVARAARHHTVEDCATQISTAIRTLTETQTGNAKADDVLRELADIIAAEVQEAMEDVAWLLGAPEREEQARVAEERHAADWEWERRETARVRA